jgi:ankyrin
VVEELLKARPALNAIDADGCNALHLAAQDGHMDIVRVLLKHGAIDGLPDRRGHTPADLARLNGHAAVARVLKEGVVVQVSGTAAAVNHLE